MATITNHLTSISPELRSGPSPGRRFLALVLSAMLVVSAVLPGLAAAEVDSEGEGTALPIEAPTPDFDPGGEETPLEEAPAASGSEEGTEEPATVEVESELDSEVPASSEVASAATEAVVSEPGHQPTVPEVQAAPTEADYVQPVENQPLQAPRQPAEHHAATSQTPAIETPVRESQSIHDESEDQAPDQDTVSSPDTDLSLAGRRFYIVRPGDWLSHIAKALLPARADDTEIAEEVARLYNRNEERIGTGDPDLIYPGTVLRLR